MGPQVAFVDANVLVSKTLRDWICLLRIETGGGLFVLHSSEDALTETAYKLRKKLPDAPGDTIAGIRASIRSALDDVLDAFPGGESFPGKDRYDRHIHAAAKECSADYLVTQDGGFAEIDPDLLPYEVHTADEFFLLVATNAPEAVNRVIRRQLEYFEDKVGAKKLDRALEDAGCPNFAACVRLHLVAMANARSTVGLSQWVAEEITSYATEE